MAVSAELVWRSGDRKRELVEFARRRRFDRAFREAFARRFGETPEVGEEQFINFLDFFVLQHRLPDGRTVVEHFVAEHPGLPEEERAMLLGWREVVEGIFRVRRRDGNALVAVNLVDELTYRLRSNLGPAALAAMRRGAFVIARLVPIGEEWLLSGASTVLPAASRGEAYRLAAELATQHPALVFRNPERLAQGRARQREERYGPAAQMPDFDLPSELGEADTVGVVYDEVEGMCFWADFGVVQETFADPTLAVRRRHREAVLGYLESPSISPLAFRRLAEPDPERASRVLRRPGFLWERDGEALLRQYKPSWFQRPVLPSVTPIRRVLSDHYRPDRRPSKGGKRS